MYSTLELLPPIDPPSAYTLSTSIAPSILPTGYSKYIVKGKGMIPVLERTKHFYYYFNSVLSLPLPLLLSYHLILSNHSVSHSLLAILFTPLFLSLSAFNSNWTSLEAFLDRSYWLLELFNAIGLFVLRKNLKISAWASVAYLLAWLGISFLFPQPPYLGPSKLTLLNSEEFDEQVLLLPPDGPGGIKSKIKEVETGDLVRNRSHLVLFHADWIRKSRELEITLSRLSWSLSSPTLSFKILTPLIAPQTFYDFSLASHAGTSDLPIVILFQGGKVVRRLPAGRDEVELEKRELKRVKKADIEGKHKISVEGDNGDESGDESEDEREVDGEVAMRRYRWDRSAEVIVRDLLLKERSAGEVPLPPEEKSKKQKPGKGKVKST